MMYGYGYGAWWMLLMSLLWIGLLAVLGLATLWLVREWLYRDRMARERSVHVRSGQSGTEVRDGTGTRRESPLEILDRRYAQGEIDPDTYARVRADLVEGRTDRA